MYKIDDGTNFGKWRDNVSRLMYHDATPTLLNGVDISGKVCDLGGGNGLLKDFIPHAISVDIDQSKKPDITEDALTHTGQYDLIVIRYLLHYLSDAEVVKLFSHIWSYHNGRILVIQFVNNGPDLKRKIANSINEKKYFRNESALIGLLSGCQERRIDIEYYVDEEFYRNRLNHPNSKGGHWEKIIGVQLNPGSGVHPRAYRG